MCNFLHITVRASMPPFLCVFMYNLDVYGTENTTEHQIIPVVFRLPSFQYITMINIFVLLYIGTPYRDHQGIMHTMKVKIFYGRHI